MTILVCPLSKAAELVDRRRPTRIISLLDPDRTFPEFGPRYTGRHLRLAFHDAHDSLDGRVPPSAEHITRLLAFFAEMTDDDESTLVHCRAGIGRSTATAFVLACWKNPDTEEIVIARELRRVAPLARPNETLVRLADSAMRRGARMCDAIRETRPDAPWLEIDESVPFELRTVFAES